MIVCVKWIYLLWCKTKMPVNICTNVCYFSKLPDTTKYTKFKLHTSFPKKPSCSDVKPAVTCLVLWHTSFTYFGDDAQPMKLTTIRCNWVLKFFWLKPTEKYLRFPSYWRLWGLQTRWCGLEKIFCLCWKLNHSSLVVLPITQCPVCVWKLEVCRKHNLATF